MMTENRPVYAGAGEAQASRHSSGSPALTPAVSLRGIRKTFGSHQALRGVDLDLFPGECLGLVGDNAAGKSTLTKIISGTYLPDDGTISLNGEEVKFSRPADARDRHIEMVFQDLSLCDHVDVVGNLFLGREITRGPFLDRQRMLAEARKMLDALEIRIPRLSAKVEKLSGGQRQAIAIARAASFNPKVLIMDEPTSALAVAEVEAVLSLINRVKATGVSVVLITHRLQDLFRVCDRIAVMYEGTKVAERDIGKTNLEDLVKLIVGEKDIDRLHRTQQGLTDIGFPE
ncbi:ATP-binding cassette domain-containing protein [Rhizobium sp. P28RR-XV]|uniref:ATP-binding cassette domain-containing protein n=1 Tax=Rhizobium sp. P28RR-XV TaxID=2726737 RepID=UPI001456C7E2|nr:ATP-binding cassette domain-containing protein [Rhizobium sp. P28RR-XV]NLR88561.1 sugar ABC transporter ATP-binding protein [Rhizobium sp. P28RR-XV]